jgi:tetratricopeptide (TPR) repeat protein
MKYQLIIMLLFLSISVIAQQDITTINQSISPKGDTIKPASKKLRTNNYKVTSSSEEAIKAGKAAAAVKRFGDAISYYFGAEAYDPTRRNEIKGLVNKAFSDITKLKNEAEASERKAKAAEQKAINALAEAKRQKTIAETKTKEAEEQKKIALEETEKTKKALEAVTKAQKVADEQRKKAVKNEEKAIKATGVAEQAKEQAEQLQIEALTVALAAKSSDIRYNNRLQGLLANEAYKFHKDNHADSLPVSTEV